MMHGQKNINFFRFFSPHICSPIWVTFGVENVHLCCWSSYKIRGNGLSDVTFCLRA